jgi:hyperosmotically inducible periplasmic protein
MRFRTLIGTCAVAALTVGCAQTDTGITTNVKNKLIADDLVKARQINVDTQDKVVTLTGQVNTAEEESRALQIARATTGVRDVIDQIDIVAPQASFPAPAPLEVPPAP